MTQARRDDAYEGMTAENRMPPTRFFAEKYGLDLTTTHQAMWALELEGRGIRLGYWESRAWSRLVMRMGFGVRHFAEDVDRHQLAARGYGIYGQPRRFDDSERVRLEPACDADLGYRHRLGDMV